MPLPVQAASEIPDAPLSFVTDPCVSVVDPSSKVTRRLCLLVASKLLLMEVVGGRVVVVEDAAVGASVATVTTDNLFVEAEVLSFSSLLCLEPRTVMGMILSEEDRDFPLSMLGLGLDSSTVSIMERQCVTTKESDAICPPVYL